MVVEAALAYAQQGIPVFPCAKDKRPLTPHGFKDASTSAEQINIWWAQYPYALIGMPTGPASGKLVLDVDVDQAAGFDGSESLAELLNGSRTLPDTVEAMTPRGGRHIYFRYPDDGTRITISAGKLAPHLDVRGDGGYVILPPSKIDGDRAYEWEGSSDPTEGMEYADCPRWLLDLMAADAATTTAKPRAEGDHASYFPEGERNDSLFRLGRSLRAKNLGEAAILAALQAENLERCDPPLDGAEVEQIARSVCTVERGQSAEYAMRALVPTPDADANYDAEVDPDGPIAGIADDDLARLFALRNPNLRYVQKWGKWLLWNGKHWQHDDTMSATQRVRGMMREVANSLDDDKFRGRLLSEARINAVLSLSRSDPILASGIDPWDKHDTVLNTPSGSIDLQTGELTPTESNAYHTKITACGLPDSPNTDCPTWRRVIDQVTGGDTDLAGFLQRVLGYCLTGTTREQALFFCYGTGANGKGTVLNTLLWIMDEYGGNAPMDLFMASTQNRHPTELAMLAGRRVVVAQETEEGRRWAESKIKSMTGGDPITARFMGQDYFTFQPKFKLLIAGNHKPELRNIDEAIQRRFFLIPFTVTIPKADRDPDLAEKLKAEGPAILRWCVDGAVEYFKRRLDPPAAVLAATSEYFEEENLFASWLSDCCTLGDSRYREKSSMLFDSWRRYAEAANVRSGNTKDFASRMRKEGFTQISTKSKGDDGQPLGRVWTGLMLSNNEPSYDAFGY